MFNILLVPVPLPHLLLQFHDEWQGITQEDRSVWKPHPETLLHKQGEMR